MNGNHSCMGLGVKQAVLVKSPTFPGPRHKAGLLLFYAPNASKVS